MMANCKLLYDKYIERFNSIVSRIVHSMSAEQQE